MCITGLTEENMKANGRMENNMALEYTLQPQGKPRRVNGMKERELIGSIENFIMVII
jgi:hypothetical protein